MKFPISPRPVALALVAAALALALGSPATSQAAAWHRPTGGWDCLVTGKKSSGNALLYFNPDNTIGGTLFMALKPVAAPRTSAPSNPRGGPTTGDPRGGAGNTNSSAASSVTNYFGSAELVGRWTFDSRGNVVGFFNSIAEGADGGITNGLNFRATVTSNRSLTLVGTDQKSGVINYRGIPVRTTTNLVGDYYLEGTIGKLRVFELVSFTDEMLSGHYYQVNNETHLGTFSGDALLSHQKVLTMVVEFGDLTSAGTLRALTGPINLRTRTATLTGAQSGGSAESNIRLKLSPVRNF